MYLVSLQRAFESVTIESNVPIRYVIDVSEQRSDNVVETIHWRLA